MPSFSFFYVSWIYLQVARIVYVTTDCRREILRFAQDDESEKKCSTSHHIITQHGIAPHITDFHILGFPDFHANIFRQQQFRRYSFPAVFVLPKHVCSHMLFRLTTYPAVFVPPKHICSHMLSRLTTFPAVFGSGI